jgi:membrane protease YdiL (CAAX protease family)
MPQELDAAAIVVGLIFLTVLGASAVLWIARVQSYHRNIVPDAYAPAWPIGWINFGIFLCVMIVTVVTVQVFAAEIINVVMSTAENDLHNGEVTPLEIDAGGTAIAPQAIEAEAPKLTPWMAVLAVLLLQLPMLAVFYSLRRFYPSHYAGRLNNQVLSIRQALKRAVPLFIRYLPVIWVVSFVWTTLLNVLQESGVIDAFPPQELITLFAQGGDRIAITLLVIFAVVLAPIVEETIFRGCIYRFLKSQTTLLPAQIISGIFFAVMHGNLMSLLPLVVVGIVLARVYEKSGNILVPICFHGFFNGFSLLMLYIMSHSSMPVG